MPNVLILFCIIILLLLLLNLCVWNICRQNYLNTKKFTDIHTHLSQLQTEVSRLDYGVHVIYNTIVKEHKQDGL